MKMMTAAAKKRRTATAYRRLSYRLDFSDRQREIYGRIADRISREADRLDEAAAARRRDVIARSSS